MKKNKEKRVYNNSFYKMMTDTNSVNNQTSAKVISRYLNKLITYHSVIDFGCGTGIWLENLQKNGVDGKDTLILGLDGNWISAETLRIRKKEFVTTNLNSKFDLHINSKFDLAVCLEVAEHIDKLYSAHLIKNLTMSSDIVLFSAAIPFQGGDLHINEQWQSYWLNIFNKEGFVCIDILRKHIWENEHVMYCYKQNIFLYVKKTELYKYPILKSWYEKFGNEFIPNIIHPECYKNLPNSGETFKEILNIWYKASIILIKKIIKVFVSLIGV